MPYDGSGNFSSLGPPDFPAITGNTISSTYYNNELNDIFSGLSTALCRDGQSTVSGHFNWNAKNLTNVGSFTASTGTFSSTLTASSTISANGLVTITSGAAEQLRLRDTTPFLSGYNAAGSARFGYLSFSATNTDLVSDSGLQFGSGGATRLTFAATGAATLSSQFTVSGGMHVTGAFTPSTGAGLEVIYSGGVSFLQSYNRTGASYQSLRLIGSTIELQPSSATVLSVASGAVSITGTLAVSSNLTVTGDTIFKADANFYVTKSGVNPAIIVDANDFIDFDRASDEYRFRTAGTSRLSVNPTGAVVTGTLGASGAITQAGNQVWHAGNFDPTLKANLASPALTGVPTAPTAAAATNTTQIATTAFVTTADNLKANLASPTFTGTITMPASMTFTANGSNPRITFASGDWLEYDVAANKLYLAIGSTNVASIDSSGNLKVLGNITASTTP